MGFVAADVIVGNGCQGPGDKGAVAVLAVDMGVDVFGTDSEILGQLGLKTHRIQHRAGTDDVFRGDAGELVECVGHDIHRIGDDDIDGIGGVFHNVGGDLPEDIHVGLGKLQPGLAGLAGQTGGDDHDGVAHGVLIMTGPDHGGGCEAGSLIDVHRLPEGLLLIDIDQQNFRGNAHGYQVVGNGGADAACADDGYFRSRGESPFSVLIRCFISILVYSNEAEM